MKKTYKNKFYEYKNFDMRIGTVPYEKYPVQIRAWNKEHQGSITMTFRSAKAMVRRLNEIFNEEFPKCDK